MSQQPVPSNTTRFLDRIVAFLMPYFIDDADDAAAARADILETLASYGTRTRAEMLAAARVIAFSMSSLDALAEARAGGLSPSQTLRARGCANGLNRSTIQNETALAKSLARPVPEQAVPPPEPVNDTADDQAQALLASAQAAIQDHRARAAAAKPARMTPPHPGAMMTTHAPAHHASPPR